MRSKLMFCFCIAMCPLFGQGNFSKFGKIAPEETLLKSCSFDTGATAVVLFDIGQISLEEEEGRGFVAKYTRHRRVKILRREGFGHGTVSIPFYSARDDESVRKAKASIYLPDGTSKAVEKAQFFTEAYDKDYTVLKFTFPDLQVGAIIEYSYEKYSKFLETLHPWYFQDEIPVVFSQVEFIYADYFKYLSLRNESVAKSVQKKDRLIYTATEMPALHEESYVKNMDDYRAKVRFQMDEYQFFSDVPPTTVLGTWDDLAKALDKRDGFGKFLRSKDNDAVRALASITIEGVTDTIERIKRIAYFVANSIQYNGFDRLFAEEASSPDKIFKKKSGSSPEINLLLVHLLNELKVTKAMPMLISSRSHGACYMKHPFLHQFDYVMGYAVAGGKPIFLDAVGALRPFDLANKEAYNKNGLVVDKKEAYWVSILPPTDGHSCSMAATLSTDGILKGHFEWYCYAYSALDERSTRNEKINMERWKKRLSDRFPNLSVQNFVTENFTNPELPLKISFDFQTPVEQSGEVFYVQPILTTEFMANPFKSETRENPISFATKYRTNIACSIDLPEGYRLDDKPADCHLVLPEKEGSIRYFTKEEGQNVAVQLGFFLDQTDFKRTGYPVLRTFFDLWAEKTNTILVIKKR